MHLTSASIHLSGKIEPRAIVTALKAEVYGRVDLDAKAYSSTVYVENSAQAAQLAQEFAKLAAEMADAEQIMARADAAEALEKTAREQREEAELADAAVRPDAELPWLGDVDRRADDDVEFCTEGE